jgi:hypothetical protein
MERETRKEKDKLTPNPFSRRRPKEMAGADTVEPGNVFPMFAQYKKKGNVLKG